METPLRKLNVEKLKVGAREQMAKKADLVGVSQADTLTRGRPELSKKVADA
jgi:hypothetical protein